jgi:hypothetical protein
MSYTAHNIRNNPDRGQYYLPNVEANNVEQVMGNTQN